MSLETGQKFHSNQYKELPYDDKVISLVHDLAVKQKQPLLHKGTLSFGFNKEGILDEEESEPIEDENFKQNLEISQHVSKMETEMSSLDKNNAQPPVVSEDDSSNKVDIDEHEVLADEGIILKNELL